jgi:hypothetical protein
MSAQAERRSQSPQPRRFNRRAFLGGAAALTGAVLMAISLDAGPRPTPVEPAPEPTQPADTNNLLRTTVLDCSKADGGAPLTAFADGEIGTAVKKAADVSTENIPPAFPAGEPIKGDTIVQKDWEKGSEFWIQDPVEALRSRRVNRGTEVRYSLMATQNGDNPMVKEMAFDENVLLKCAPVKSK